MKKLMLLGLMVLMVFTCTIGCGKQKTETEEVKVTDEQLVISYLNHELGEDGYDSVIIDETNGYDYLIAYRVYNDGHFLNGGAVDRNYCAELYYGTN